MIPDAERAGLRAIVETIDHEMACLSRQTTPEESRRTTARLLASWAGLIKTLALGPAPETRECPVCKQIGMRAATRCGYCWATLSPPTPREGEQGACPTRPS